MRLVNYLTFEVGDIIVAPIPFSNLVQVKLRPALVIRPKETDDLIVLKITSKGNEYPFDVELTGKDLEKGSLASESVIQVDFPIVIEKQAVQQIIGKITSKKLTEVKQKIKELYEL